jgi:hypothetical protein
MDCVPLERLLRLTAHVRSWVNLTDRDDRELCGQGCSALVLLKYTNGQDLPSIDAFRLACANGSLETVGVLIDLYSHRAVGRARTFFLWAAGEEALDAASRGSLPLVRLLVDRGMANFSQHLIEQMYQSGDAASQHHARHLDAVEGYPVMKRLLWGAVERRDNQIFSLLNNLIPADIGADLAAAKTLYECPSTLAPAKPTWMVIKFAWERFGCVPTLPDPQCALWDAMSTSDTAALQFFESIPPDIFNCDDVD